MKKKLALLLALTMVVSLLPMNVFGQTTLYVPDRDENVKLPASIVDLLRIDLADLDSDENIYSTRNIEGDTPGYPIMLELTNDAVFGAATGGRHYEHDYSGRNALTNNTEIQYDGNNSTNTENLKRLIEYVNVMDGYWSRSGDFYTPARVLTVNDNGTSMTRTEVRDYMEDYATAGVVDDVVAASAAYDNGNGTLPNGYSSWAAYLNEKLNTFDGLTRGEVFSLSKVNPNATTTSGLLTITDADDASGANDTSIEVSNVLAWNSAGGFGWSDFDSLYNRTVTKPVYAQNVPYAFTVTYDYEIWDDNQIVLFVQVFDDITGEMTSIPEDLDEGEFFVEFALPVLFDGSDNDDYEAELILTDMIHDDDEAFEGFPKRLITSDKGTMTVDVQTTASFANTGFLDVVTLNESEYGFLEKPLSTDDSDSERRYRTVAEFRDRYWVDTNTNGIVEETELSTTQTTGSYGTTGYYDTGIDEVTRWNYENEYDSTPRTRVVELRLDSDYAWLMENNRERLKFQDRHDTFHNDATNSDSEEAYDYLEYFGADDEFEDIDYNFSYQFGNRRINRTADDTEFDLRFFFSGETDDIDDDVEPTDQDNISARYGNSERPDELSIFNLMVGFDDRQKLDENIPLQYRVYDINTDDINDDNDNDRDYIELDEDIPSDEWVDADNIPVQRKADVVQLDLLDGRLGAAIDTPEKVVSGRFEEETTPFRISEVVNGTWDDGITTISVGNGVEITGAHVSVYEYNFDEYDTADRTDDGDRIESTSWDSNRNFADEDYWTDDTNSGKYDEDYLHITRHQDFYNNGGIRINNKEITLDPRMTGLTTEGERREVEVQLEVSIEAGYVQKYGSNNIDVTFSGSGASNFEASTFTVATVRDPIVVSPVTPVTLEADWAMSGYSQNIGDITITESEAGDLEQNDEIWLYVVGNRAIDLNLTAGANPIVGNQGDSGLRLYDGRQLRHQFSNFWLSGMRYNVERSSGLGSTSVSNAPATITFQDVTISGAMYAGAEYQIVVSGDAIAANDEVVFANSNDTVSNANDDDYNTLNDVNDTPGVFPGGTPYVVPAINWEGSTYTDIPSDTPPAEGPATEPPSTPPVVVVPRMPQEFGPYSYSTDETGTFNNYYMAAASNGQGFAGISPRAFAIFIGGTTEFDNATQVATITGLDNNGSEVVVELTVGSTSASINGQTVDIATYNEHPGYPVGSITPFNPGNGRLYLPIRFLCKAYGVGFNYNDLTKSVTLQ